MENWKDFPGQEERYEISDLGRCRSKDRVSLTDGHIIKGKLMSPYVKKDCGYVVIRLGYLKIEYKIHRAVAKAFLPNPLNKPEVNHLKGKQDNRAISLEWATPKENSEHAWRNNLIGKNKKISIADVLFIREHHLSLEYDFLAIMFNVSKHTIYAIATGKARTKVISEIKKRPKIYKNVWSRRRVIDSDSGRIYESIKDAAIDKGLIPKYLQRQLSGERVNKTSFRYFLSV